MSRKEFDTLFAGAEQSSLSQFQRATEQQIKKALTELRKFRATLRHLDYKRSGETVLDIYTFLPFALYDNLSWVPRPYKEQADKLVKRSDAISTPFLKCRQPLKDSQAAQYEQRLKEHRAAFEEYQKAYLAFLDHAIEWLEKIKP